jgi:hypothetical protein
LKSKPYVRDREGSLKKEDCCARYRDFPGGNPSVTEVFDASNGEEMEIPKGKRGDRRAESIE